MTPLTRRHHLQQLFGTAALGSLSPLAAQEAKRPAPSERVTLALLGAGSQGTNDMRGFLQDERVQVVAVADPERESRRYNRHFKSAFGREPARRTVEKHYAAQQGKSGTGSFCKAYEDFREVEKAGVRLQVTSAEFNIQR